MRLGGVAAALACVVVLPSCGDLGDLLRAGDGASEPRVAKVVVLVPDDGPQAGDGAGVVAAVESALADSEPSIPRVTQSEPSANA